MVQRVVVPYHPPSGEPVGISRAVSSIWTFWAVSEPFGSRRGSDWDSGGFWWPNLFLLGLWLNAFFWFCRDSRTQIFAPMIWHQLFKFVALDHMQESDERCSDHAEKMIHRFTRKHPWIHHAIWPYKPGAYETMNCLLKRWITAALRPENTQRWNDE